MLLRTFLLTAALAVLAVAPAAAQNAVVGNLSIDNAWTRATPPRAPNGGAFMTINNDGGEPDRLVAASTPQAIRTELHTHRMEDGVMRMRPVEGGIEVPAGGSVTLAPGGLQVMLLGLKAPLAEGATVPLTLTFEKAGTVTIEVAVTKAGASAPMGGPMGGHGKMMDGEKPAMPKH